MTANDEKITPFSNGTEFTSWTGRNCDKCVKGWDGKSYPESESKCDIEEALSIACIGDGLIPLSMWKRAGEGSGRCPEFVWQDPDPKPANDYSEFNTVGLESLDKHWQEIDGKKKLVF